MSGASADVLVGISQPTYLPWLGYFDLMDQVDVFVLLDQVQFSRHSWQQRNRVKGANDTVVLSVPVSDTGLATRLDEALIADRRTITKHLTTIRQCYVRAPFASEVLPRIAEAYEAAGATLLSLTVGLIDVVRDLLGVTTPIILASTLGATGTKDDLVRSICSRCEATRYLAAPGSREYMEAGTAFSDGRIEVVYHEYHPAEYVQLHGPFVPYLSAIDAILNLGDGAREAMLAGRTSSA